MPRLNGNKISLHPATETTAIDLPLFCKELEDLPYGLGEIQAYIFGRQIYPSKTTASATAIAALQSYASAFVTINSFGGLGLNEYFILLAPTGYGKEESRRAIESLYGFPVPADRDKNLEFLSAPKIQYQAPASQQAMHKALEDKPAQFIMSDEFAEWIIQSKSNSHTQAMVGYLMQLYTSATGTVTAPQSIQGQYTPVKNPRVSIFATTTGERLAEALTQSQAESGVYNRMVLMTAEQSRIQKRYSGFTYEPSPKAIEPFQFISQQLGGEVSFTKHGWKAFVEQDREVFEALKFDDPALAGRLSEQAIKLAATIAMSDSRMQIDQTDMNIAFAIRKNLYERSKVFLVGSFGALSDGHDTVKATDQIRAKLTKCDHISVSRLRDYSRAFRKISVREQKDVIQQLIEEGAMEEDSSVKGRMASRIREPLF